MARLLCFVAFGLIAFAVFDGAGPWWLFAIPVIGLAIGDAILSLSFIVMFPEQSSGDGES